MIPSPLSLQFLRSRASRKPLPASHFAYGNDPQIALNGICWQVLGRFSSFVCYLKTIQVPISIVIRSSPQSSFTAISCLSALQSWTIGVHSAIADRDENSGPMILSYQLGGEWYKIRFLKSTTETAGAEQPMSIKNAVGQGQDLPPSIQNNLHTHPNIGNARPLHHLRLHTAPGADAWIK